MLTKNIYLIYPPGYSGSYVSWCIYKSELDTSDQTIDNPINVSSDKKYGGYGTAHLHHRIPTHTNIEQLMYWLILHKPTDKKVFLVNAPESHYVTSVSRTINHILNFDRDPVIIQITGSDTIMKAVANLNAVTKWPLFFDIQGHNKKFNINFEKVDTTFHTRNICVNHFDVIFDLSHPINFDNIDDKSLSYVLHREFYTNWYTIRNSNNPHEVNNTQYIEPIFKPEHFYNLDLSKIYRLDFASTLKSMVDIAGDFDFSYVNNFHHNYIECQQHLQFIVDFENFKNNKILSEYLLSNPLSQAMVILSIKDKLPPKYDWESKSLQEIVKVYNDITGP